MQDTNIPVSSTMPVSAQEPVATHPLSAVAAVAPATRSRQTHPQGLLQRVMAFVRRLFLPVAYHTLATLPANKAAAPAKAALPPAPQQPVAFKGGTAITLATPMGAYAGKPGQQRLRKLAEQQFHQLDVSQTTMN